VPCYDSVNENKEILAKTECRLVNYRKDQQTLNFTNANSKGVSHFRFYFFVFERPTAVIKIQHIEAPNKFHGHPADIRNPIGKFPDCYCCNCLGVRRWKGRPRSHLRKPNISVCHVTPRCEHALFLHECFSDFVFHFVCDGLQNRVTCLRQVLCEAR
jgi:hypothetical protein